MSKHQDKKYVDTKRVVLSIISFIIIIILLGAFLFHLAEGRGYFNSLYFTVITFSTIGYGDVTPHTQLGKIIAMIYALLGVPLFVGITSVIMEIRFKKFVFHNFEHHIKSFQKADEELKQELVEEEIKNMEQTQEINKIEKEIRLKKISIISKLLKKLKLK